MPVSLRYFPEKQFQFTDSSFRQVFDDSDSLFNGLTSLFSDSWARPGVDLRPEMLPLGFFLRGLTAKKIGVEMISGCFLNQLSCYFRSQQKESKFNC